MQSTIDMREEEAKKASFRSEWTSCVSKKPAGWRAQCLEILHKEEDSHCCS